MFMKILIVGIISLSVATATVSINDLDIEKLKPLVPEGVLPDGIIPEGLNTTLLVDNARKVIKEKCQNVSNSEDAYLKAESAATVFQECLMGLVDYEALEKEIEEAKPKGDLDVVFNKYCGKRNIAIECMKVFTSAIEPCLDEKEVAGKTTLVKIFKNLLEFVCHKEGDQIALFIADVRLRSSDRVHRLQNEFDIRFIAEWHKRWQHQYEPSLTAEKGPECFTSKQAGLTTCINDTMFGYIPSETPSVDNLPLLVLGAQQCNDMDTIQQCIVRELNTCEETTPANIVEALLNYVRNETPCGNMTSPNSSTLKGNKNAAFTPKTSWTILSTALVTIVAWSL